jgi:hypothetical protein
VLKGNQYGKKKIQNPLVPQRDPYPEKTKLGAPKKFFEKPGLATLIALKN